MRCRIPILLTLILLLPLTLLTLQPQQVKCCPVCERRYSGFFYTLRILKAYHDHLPQHISAGLILDKTTISSVKTGINVTLEQCFYYPLALFNHSIVDYAISYLNLSEYPQYGYVYSDSFTSKGVEVTGGNLTFLLYSALLLNNSFILERAISLAKVFANIAVKYGLKLPPYKLTSTQTRYAYGSIYGGSYTVENTTTLDSLTGIIISTYTAGLVTGNTTLTSIAEEWFNTLKQLEKPYIIFYNNATVYQSAPPYPANPHIVEPLLYQLKALGYNTTLVESIVDYLASLIVEWIKTSSVNSVPVYDSTTETRHVMLAFHTLTLAYDVTGNTTYLDYAIKLYDGAQAFVDQYGIPEKVNSTTLASLTDISDTLAFIEYAYASLQLYTYTGNTTYLNTYNNVTIVLYENYLNNGGYWGLPAKYNITSKTVYDDTVILQPLATLISTLHFIFKPPVRIVECTFTNRTVIEAEGKIHVRLPILSGIPLREVNKTLVLNNTFIHIKKKTEVTLYFKPTFNETLTCIYDVKNLKIANATIRIDFNHFTYYPGYGAYYPVMIVVDVEGEGEIGVKIPALMLDYVHAISLHDKYGNIEQLSYYTDNNIVYIQTPRSGKIIMVVLDLPEITVHRPYDSPSWLVKTVKGIHVEAWWYYFGYIVKKMSVEVQIDDKIYHFIFNTGKAVIPWEKILTDASSIVVKVRDEYYKPYYSKLYRSGEPTCTLGVVMRRKPPIIIFTSVNKLEIRGNIIKINFTAPTRKPSGFKRYVLAVRRLDNVKPVRIYVYNTLAKHVLAETLEELQEYTPPAWTVIDDVTYITYEPHSPVWITIVYPETTASTTTTSRPSTATSTTTTTPSTTTAAITLQLLSTIILILALILLAIPVIIAVVARRKRKKQVIVIQL